LTRILCPARLRSSLFFGGTVGSKNLSTILALRAKEEEKRKSWKMAVRIEKIVATVLDEANGWQVEEVMAVLSEGPEGFYG
jgi:hypothetical protein